MNEDTLKTISNKTIDSIHTIDIVTPTIYKSIFTQFAQEHNTSLDNEELLTDNVLSSKIILSNKLMKETSQNTMKLSEQTSQAILAIQDKDEVSLQLILNETKKLKEEIESLKKAVYKDELTASFNRRWLNDKYIDVTTNALNTNGVLSIIDLNYFKIINDTHGHIVGDKVLIYLASQLKKSKASVIRYGGDEFIVIFTNTSKNTAKIILDNIRETIISKKLKNAGSTFRVSFSIGHHEFKLGDNLEDTIESADKDMYNDKINIKKRIKGIN